MLHEEGYTGRKERCSLISQSINGHQAILNHRAARGELDSAAAQRIVAITDDGDQGLIALRVARGIGR
ncbi:hypothetical protein D3C81_1142480 [compost metagenome]